MFTSYQPSARRTCPCGGYFERYESTTGYVLRDLYLGEDGNYHKNCPVCVADLFSPYRPGGALGAPVRSKAIHAC